MGEVKSLLVQNSLVGHILPSLENLCWLKSLSLSENKLSEGFRPRALFNFFRLDGGRHFAARLVTEEKVVLNKALETELAVVLYEVVEMEAVACMT
ncbi:hypothetical protein LguiA_023395 [Lonicera macranthoides]